MHGVPDPTAERADLIVVSFAHQITQLQHQQIAALTGWPPERIQVVHEPADFDHGESFDVQAAELVARVKLPGDAWEVLPLVVNLPSFVPIAALVLARLHGLMGHFPTILRLRPVQGSSPLVFEVAELLDLNAARSAGRSARR